MSRINLNGKIHTANSYMRSECIENGLVASASSTQIRMFRLYENDNRWLHFVFEANHCIYLLFIWHTFTRTLAPPFESVPPEWFFCFGDYAKLSPNYNCMCDTLGSLQNVQQFSEIVSFRVVSLQFTAFGSIGLIAGKRCQNRYDLRMSAHA